MSKKKRGIGKIAIVISYVLIIIVLIGVFFAKSFCKSLCSSCSSSQNSPCLFLILFVSIIFLVDAASLYLTQRNLKKIK